MSRGWVHTLYESGRWVNKIEGDSQAASRHETKDAAVAKGRQMAKQRKTEHVIHKMDGTIDQRNSYGNDPFPPRG